LARGEITLSEINSQPQLWATALDIFEQQAQAVGQFWANGGYEQVLFTGCGSTFYLGVIGATMLQAATGVPARANTASELMLFPQVNVALKAKTLLVCVSRSGTTRETVEAARLFHAEANGQVLVITCQSDSPLAQEADFLIAIDAAQERSRVQTRSFSSMAVIVTALAALLGGRDWQELQALPAALECLMTASAPLVPQLGNDARINQFAFLGSGAQYGLAVEAMLKMTEMSRIFSVSYHILEYLHGPRYAADANTLVIGLVGDTAYDEEIKALKPLALRRARVLALAEADRGGLADFDYALPLASGVPEWGRTILYLPPLQLIGFHQAMMLGFDPDNLPFDPRDPVQP
jgi:glucosamine--fructose-6-phosphate aminotransferase (isomerizing)